MTEEKEKTKRSPTVSEIIRFFGPEGFGDNGEAEYDHDREEEFKD